MRSSSSSCSGSRGASRAMRGSPFLRPVPPMVRLCNPPRAGLRMTPVPDTLPTPTSTRKGRPMIVNQRAFAVLASALLALVSTAPADVPRALPLGTLPQDARLGKLRTLDDYFPFTPVESPQAWAKRAADLRRQAQVATGLWPMPTRTPLEATVHGK